MRNKGATLVLVVAGVFILVIIGLGILCFVNLFGGSRELQHLTDSGVLNLGKQQVTNGIPLNQTDQQIQFNCMWYPYWDVSNRWPGTWETPAVIPMDLPNGMEGSSFAYLVDNNGNINLQNYNRIIAQTLLVGMNAQAEGTMPAAANAQTLYDAVQRLHTSISERLLSKLSDPSSSSSIFMNTAAANSLRMLGIGSTPQFQSDSYQVSYYSRGACTNVYIDPKTIPVGMTMPSGSLSTEVGPTNIPYMTGYVDIEAGPFAIQGTPVFPGQQPHLISESDFQTDLTSPVASGYVAPNSFSASCGAPNSVTPTALKNSSAATVGLLGQSYAGGIPEGYVVVHNIIGSVTGTVPQMITSLAAADQARIMTVLKQRLHQIMPEYTDTQVVNFINTQVISHDKNAPTYIYRYPELNSPLYSAWHQQLLATAVPDGTPNQLFGSIVPPPTFPKGQINRYYGVIPDGLLEQYPGTGFKAHWTPSSGFQNLLGLLAVP